jgi:hypothetical protein
MQPMSGAQPRPKRLIESCLTLDIDVLLQQGVLMPGFSTKGRMYWTGAGGESAFVVDYVAEFVHPALSWLEMRFHVPDPGTGELRRTEQTIPLTRTYAGFGRVRYWFVDEGRRVGKLYLPEGSDQFRSRHVHRLAYASQSLTRRERRTRREVKIRGRLGADPNSTGIPPKPPRMRWKTYCRLIRTLRREETRAAVEEAISLFRFSE